MELIYKEIHENLNEKNNIFIPTNNNWLSTEDKNYKVTESGEKGILFNAIVEKINNAKELICLQSFLIQDTSIIDAMLKAQKERGVKVYVLDSAEARLETSIEEDENFATEDYKKMLKDKFKNHFVHRQAGNLHAKFILIDPKTNPRGYLFTGNFNNKPFFENPELAVSLIKEQITGLYKIFVYHFWEHTTHEQTKSKDFASVKREEKFPEPQISNILLTSPNNNLSNLKNTLLETISNAKSEITFSTFGFDINHEISKKILEKQKEGIIVNVFCRPRQKAINNNISILLENGANVYCHPLIHAKSLTIDKKISYIFTANFESHGMDSGFEIGVELSKIQNDALLLIHENWKNTFPYKYIKSITYSEIDKYYDFDKNGYLVEGLIKKEETKSNNRTIKITNDLLEFFAIDKIPSNLNSKMINIERRANFKPLKTFEEIKTIRKGIKLVKYSKTTNKKKNLSKYIECLKVDITIIQNDIDYFINTIKNDDLNNLEIYC